MFHTPDTPEAQYTDVLELDMGTVVPSLAGPKRPQDRIALTEAKGAVEEHLHLFQSEREGRPSELRAVARLEGEGGSTAIGAEESHHVGGVKVRYHDQEFLLKDGAVVIAAITSCTNTSNPSVIMGAGLLAKKAAEKGLTAKPWVKSSLAPGSQVVTRYLEAAGLLQPLAKLGFDVVGYGCTTCIGNAGPLPEPIGRAVQEEQLAVCAVLSGNRNFEGRIHADVKMNFLASPPLVVAYALPGEWTSTSTTSLWVRMPGGNPVYLKDLWPDQQEVQQAIAAHVSGVDVPAKLCRRIHRRRPLAAGQNSRGRSL